jgi:hypothetical protein
VAIFSLAWLPLFLACGLQEFFGQAGVLRSFMLDIKIHANFFLAAPLLSAAEAIVGRRLSQIVRHFENDGLICKEHLPRFRRITQRARIWLTRREAVFTVAAAAYIFAVGAVFSVGPGGLTAWNVNAARNALSPAGWWHMLVSLPIFVALILGWLWRLTVWTKTLAEISRLDMNLVPSHPDHSCGLAFVGYSLRALWPFGLSIGVIGAGSVASAVLRYDTGLTPSLLFTGSLAVITLVICSLPAFVFVPRLIAEWWRAVFAYNALAIRQSRTLNARWIESNRSGRDPSQAADFSSAADFFQLVGNVHAIRPVPIDLGSVAFFLIATLLPFIPAALVLVPPIRILEGLRSLVL